jgi:hypothetical protein
VPEFGRTQYCFGAVVLTWEGMRLLFHVAFPDDAHLECHGRRIGITQLQCLSDLTAERS